MLIYHIFFVLLALSHLKYLHSVKGVVEDQKISEESKGQKHLKRFRQKSAGYDGKAMTSVRTAKRYIREGKFIDFHEALKTAEKDFTEKKRAQKAKENAKRKALGLPRKKSLSKKKYVRNQTKEHIITTRVIKMLGRETDLEKIKEAKIKVEADFRRQKRVNSARAAHKKKALAEGQGTRTQNEGQIQYQTNNQASL